MITANGTWSDEMQVAESIQVFIQGIIIPLSIIIVKSEANLLVMSCLVETFSQNWLSHLDDESYFMTYSAIDG